ncbi:hypothetical protein QAD02_020059 [Eretmocerus hayati]|uniref:Uncharacterized protein n=1 Tax=Eretmocerus hayati TaxID=131215 RepID=A0ACC2PPJ3_9HYME|nr:hypothetical protein QAD02_020059 [Eretmocerus hayati]
MVRNSVITMEPTFYEEQMYGSPGARPLALTSGLSPNPSGGPLKRPNLSLDLNSATAVGAGIGTPGTRTPGGSKRSRLLSSLGSAAGLLTPLLNSPGDLLKINSPEFEKLLIAQQDGGIVTTMPTPTSQIYFGEKIVTEEQEQYARGFVEALNELHHSDSSQEPSSIHGGGSNSTTYTNLEPPLHVGDSPVHLPGHYGLLHHVKDEPQTVPSVSSSPGPMSPIDMESQEKIKLERKRQRNRVAASKCRRRKLERISRLEDKVKLLKGENSDLSQVVNRLREHVARLKEQVIDHMHSGCQISSLPGII